MGTPPALTADGVDRARSAVSPGDLGPFLRTPGEHDDRSDGGPTGRGAGLRSEREVSAVYHKLLVTHDGSDVADIAVPHAIALALAVDAEVLLLRVVDSPAQAMAGLGAQAWREAMDDGTLATAGASSTRQQHEEAQASLAGLRMRFLAAGIGSVETLVVEGDPGKVIVETAAEHGRDLIVMATHGRSGVRRALLGSVADYVVRHQRGCPVVLCCPEADDPA